MYQQRVLSSQQCLSPEQVNVKVIPPTLDEHSSPLRTTDENITKEIHIREKRTYEKNNTYHIKNNIHCMNKEIHINVTRAYEQRDIYLSKKRELMNKEINITVKRT